MDKIFIIEENCKVGQQAVTKLGAISFLQLFNVCAYQAIQRHLW